MDHHVCCIGQDNKTQANLNLQMILSDFECMLKFKLKMHVQCFKRYFQGEPGLVNCVLVFFSSYSRFLLITVQILCRSNAFLSPNQHYQSAVGKISNQMDIQEGNLVENA